MRSKPKSRLLAPQELEIMKIVWNQSPVTVRDVYEVLRRRRTVAYTTVMTTMQILEKKGFLKKSSDQRAHVYQAVKTQSKVASALLRDFIDRVFNGRLQPLLLHLVADGHLSKKDLEELRKRLDEQ